MWTAIKGSETVDTSSELYEAIDGASSYFLYSANFSRPSIGLFEAWILPLNHAFWFLREEYKHQARTHLTFIRKHHVAHVIRKYVGIQSLINVRAAEIVVDLEDANSRERTLDFWRSRIRDSALPFHRSASLLRISRYLRREIRDVRQRIGEARRYKFEFSPWAIPPAVAVTGALMVASSYLRVLAIFTYFGIPFGDYFTIADYLSNSITIIDDYLVLAAIAALIWFLGFSAGTASLWIIGGDTDGRKAVRGVDWWIWRVGGLLSAVLLVAGYVNNARIEPAALSFLILALGTMFWDSSFVDRHFTNTLQLTLCGLFLTLGIAHLAGSTAWEINRILDPKAGASRIFYFRDATFEEAQWKVMAVTSDFLIFREYESGRVQVMPKYQLTGVDH